MAASGGALLFGGRREHLDLLRPLPGLAPGDE